MVFVGVVAAVVGNGVDEGVDFVVFVEIPERDVGAVVAGCSN